MAVLSDRDIKKRIMDGSLVIDGVDLNLITLASVDLKLGNKFKVFKTTQVTHIDTKESIPADMMETIEKKDSEPFILHPGEFVLGSTKEYVKMPEDLVGRLDGRSSLGRLGVVIHSTAGSVDPGFEGLLTLEIANISKIPVSLWPGSRVCRLTFDTLSSPSETPYNKRKESKYNKQQEPVASRIFLDK
ncbi:dCTP deaminase [Candidatus Woesearchaeota archaeon]|nr:dCTP deaminase [Candidatus Woesearchaeota archaeon]